MTTDAQQAGRVYRIGWLGNAPYLPHEWQAFAAGLGERGWVEGRNFTIEHRYSEGRNERFPALVAELLRGKPDLLVTGGSPATAAARQATTTIPIVFYNAGDPVISGFAASQRFRCTPRSISPKSSPPPAASISA